MNRRFSSTNAARFSPRFNQPFFFDRFLRCFFAAFMLSARFGYGRPARFAGGDSLPAL
jgi:hypothetical protein